MCPGPKTGQPVGQHCWEHFLMATEACTGAGLPPEPILVSTGQPYRWEQCHMQFTNKQLRAICTEERLLPMCTPGDRRNRADWFSLARPPVRLGEDRWLGT